MFRPCRVSNGGNEVKRSTILQKLFSAFPSGSPGLGLLLLRGFVAITLFTQGLAYLNSRELSVPGVVAAALAFIAALCLLIGLLTPLVSVLTCIGAMALIAFNSHFSTAALIGVIVLAAAIALLGPGAFSVDSRLFGRREILIPHATREPHR